MPLKPCYLIAGDTLLVEEKFKTLVKPFKAEISGEVEEHLYYLAETDLARVLSEARGLPFLATAQIFIVRDLHKIKKDDIEALERYLEKPNPVTALFFQTDEIAKTDKLVKVITQYGETHFLAAKDAKSAVRQFIKEKLRSAGKSMSHGGMAKLEQEAGEMPAFLDSMLERLIVYSGDQKEITDDMVDTFAEDFSEGDVFKMINALADRKAGEAYAHLRRVLEDNERDLVGLLGILHWQIRRLWVASSLFAQGLSRDAVLRECKISYRQAPFFVRQVQSFQTEDLARALEGLFQLDWKLKTGRVDGVIALETWLFDVAKVKPSSTSFSRARR